MIQILSLLLIRKCLKLVQVHELRIDTSLFLFPLHWRSLQSSTKYLQTALHRLRDRVATLSQCNIKLETATSIFFVIFLIWSCGHLPSSSRRHCCHRHLCHSNWSKPIHTYHLTNGSWLEFNIVNSYPPFSCYSFLTINLYVDTNEKTQKLG